MDTTGDGTGADFVDHWDWAASRGLLNRNTANALKAAARAVLSIEGDNWESESVLSINIDNLLDRFENLRKKDFTPESLATYRSRFKRAHQLYSSFLADPRNYHPQTREREKSGSPLGTPKRERRKDVETLSGAGSESGQLPTLIGTKLIRYPFPVREGVIAELLLPVDLRKEEARRLAAFLESLSMSSEVTKLLPPAGQP